MIKKLSSLTRYKTVTKYLFSSFLSLPVSLITGFIAFKNIDPYLMGVWGTIAVFESYANFLRLGVINGMNRELPFALGAGKKENADLYAQTTLAFTIFGIIFIAVLTPILLLTFEFNDIYIRSILVLYVKISLTFYNIYLIGTFRSDDNFNKLSNIQFTIILTNLIFSPLILFGYNGFLTTQLITVITNTILLHYNRPFQVKPKFHYPSFKRLMKIGIPLFLSSYLISLIDTFPRLYIINFGNEKLMGLYAPVSMLLSTFSLLPNILSTYLYPKFSYNLGKSNDIKGIWKSLKKMYVVSIGFILFFASVIYLLIDYFIILFPKYSESLPYLKLSLIICPFIIYKTGNMLNAILKKNNFMIFYVLIYAFVQTVSLYSISLLKLTVLNTVIYSQIVASISMSIVSILLNSVLIKNINAKDIDGPLDVGGNTYELNK